MTQIRATIRKHLENLKKDLDQYDQTTHGLLTHGSIDQVGHYIARAYNAPDAYSNSNLVQAIEQFLKGESDS